MKRIGPLLAPALLAPIALAGLALWRDQAALIWLSGFFAACL